MRKHSYILFLLWSAISSAQLVSFQSMPSSGLKLITTKCILLDGKIVNSPSFEALSYNDGYSSVPDCVAPDTHAGLPLKHTLYLINRPVSMKIPGPVITCTSPVFPVYQMNDADTQALVKAHAQANRKKTNDSRTLANTNSYAGGHSPVFLIALYEAVATDRHWGANHTDSGK